MTATAQVTSRLGRDAEAMARARQALNQLTAQAGTRLDVALWAFEAFGSLAAAPGCLGVTGTDHDDIAAQILDRLSPFYDDLVEAQAGDPEMRAALRRLASARRVAS